jgi:predicted Zn finger-like uncharacterized protein
MVSNPLTNRLLGSVEKVLLTDSPMLIVCPSCATSYNVDSASLQPNGRQVRCVRCRTVWHAQPGRAELLSAAAEAIARPPVATGHAATLPSGKSAPSLAPASIPSANTLPQFATAPAPITAAGGRPEPSPEASDFAILSGDNGASSETPADAAGVEAPSLAPGDAAAAPVANAGAHGVMDDEPREDIESYAARRRQRRNTKRRALRWPLTQLQNAIVVLLIVDAVLIGWRNDVVRLLPQTASLYATMGLGVNLRGLVFEDMKVTTEQRDGVPILVVDGNIVNDSGKLVDVARIKFAARNAAREEIYAWTAVPPRAALPAGATEAFHSRLASPPPEVRDILVRFVTRRDILSGMR